MKCPHRLADLHILSSIFRPCWIRDDYDKLGLFAARRLHRVLSSVALVAALLADRCTGGGRGCWEWVLHFNIIYTINIAGFRKPSHLFSSRRSTLRTEKLFDRFVDVDNSPKIRQNLKWFSLTIKISTSCVLKYKVAWPKPCAVFNDKRSVLINNWSGTKLRHCTELLDHQKNKDE